MSCVVVENRNVRKAAAELEASGQVLGLNFTRVGPLERPGIEVTLVRERVPSDVLSILAEHELEYRPALSGTQGRHVQFVASA
jgi:hypothetical protein